jgi:DNA-binding NtrC family response regulator
MRDETTLTAGDAAASSLDLALQPTPALTIVHHREPKLIGQRFLVTGGAPAVLGRGSPHFDESVFDHANVSRRHCAVSVSSTGAVHLVDLGSRNGTRVNGALIASTDLNVGDVVSLGDALLLFHDAPRGLSAPSATGMLAASAGMQEVLASVRRLAPGDRTLLVQGPSGTGKELVAREIHAVSRRKGELVAVNCGAMSDQLLLSDLFGHARGSFSGATVERTGLVERARGGTLFLDEVGDASPALQVALLRLLEQREYRRVGEDSARATDTRFVAATHVPLEAAVATGRFRADLLGRIAGFPITVPALCRRPDDIVPFALAFARARAGSARNLSARLTFALLRHPWPLNVRELAAVIEQAQLEAEPDAALDLTPDLARRLTQEPSPQPPARAALAPRKTRGALVERPAPDELRAALTRTSGNMRRLATDLGVARSTLYRWFDELKIDGETAPDVADDNDV